MVNQSGDGTVSQNSAVFSFTNSELFNVNHPGLPSDRGVIEKIFDTLGLDKTQIEILPNDTRKSVFTAILKSPGRLEVCNSEGTVCDGKLGIYNSDGKMFMLPGYTNEKLRVRVYEDKMGTYKLHMGDIDEKANWKVIEGEITKIGQVDSYDITSNDQVLTVFPDQITSNSLLSACNNQMTLINSKWDKFKSIDVLTNSKSSDQQKLRAINLLRLSLGTAIWKANKANQSIVVDTAINCWNDFDNVIKNIYIGMADKLANLVERKISKTNNQNAVKLLQAGKDKVLETKLLGSGNRKLGQELSSSSEGLLLLSLSLGTNHWED